MKLLLYCTKSKPYLIHESGCYDSDDMCCDYDCFSVVDRQELYNQDISLDETYNGKIVAECDFEVKWESTDWSCMTFTERQGLEKSCLTKEQLFDYVKGRNEFYAIHIKNLNIFYTPKELNECEHFTTKYGGMEIEKVKKAPQNMMSVMLTEKGLDDYILISIRPEWLYKILNGEKTIEVRKKVLREMIK